MNLEFYSSTTCSCVSIELEFWQQVSHIVWPPAPPLFSKLSEAAKTPLCPQAPTSSTPHLALAAAPMTPHPLLLFRPATPTAACIPHSHSVREPEARTPKALTTLSVTHLVHHAAYRIMSYTLPLYFSVCYTDLTMHVHCITAS